MTPVSMVPTNYYTAKYDSTGNILWSRIFDSGHGNVKTGMAVDSSGNVYVTGYTVNPIVHDHHTIKYDANGNEVWDKITNKNAELPVELFTDINDFVYIASIVSNIGPNSFVIKKLDPEGNEIWSQTFNTLTPQTVRYVSMDKSANYAYILGSFYDGSNFHYFLTKYDFAGNVIWEIPTVEKIRDIAADSFGNLYVAAGAVPGTRGHALIIKYDSNGKMEWDAIYTPGAYTYNVAQRIAFDKFGDVYVAGTIYTDTYRRNDFFSVKYDQDGNRIWSMSYDEKANSDRASGIAVSGDGSVYLAGESFAGQSSYGYNDTNILLIKYQHKIQTFLPNQLPVADAGPDLTVIDDNGSGTASVTLNGSGSFDPDGTIVEYYWYVRSTNSSSYNVKTNQTLPIGTHTISLRIHDNEGAYAKDRVIITVIGNSPDDKNFHIQSIDLSTSKKGNKWSANATITVVDSLNIPVEGATVYGSWSGDVTGDVSGTTSGGKRSKGQITLSSSSVTGGGTFIFTVTDIVLPGGTYDPETNGETSDSVTVP